MQLSKTVEEQFPEEWLGLSPQELILTMWERIKELERALDVLVD